LDRNAENYPSASTTIETAQTPRYLIRRASSENSASGDTMGIGIDTPPIPKRWDLRRSVGRIQQLKSLLHVLVAGREFLCLKQFGTAIAK